MLLNKLFRDPRLAGGYLVSLLGSIDLIDKLSFLRHQYLTLNSKTIYGFISYIHIYMVYMYVLYKCKPTITGQNWHLKKRVAKITFSNNFLNRYIFQ